MFRCPKIFLGWIVFLVVVVVDNAETATTVASTVAAVLRNAFGEGSCSDLSLENDRKKQINPSIVKILKS